MKHGVYGSAARRAVLAPLFLLLPTALVACGDDDGTAPADVAAAKTLPNRSGTLGLTVSGIPEGTASVRVVGPSGYARVLAGTETLTGLRKGTYTLTAASVSIEGTSYVPAPSTQQVPVADGTPASVAITYTAVDASRGTLTVTVNGLPAGAAASATVAGPDGYSVALDGSHALSDLASGDYTVSAAPVTTDGSTYQPAPAAQTVSVVAGQSVDAKVTYSTAAATRGSLNVAVTGLPVGTSAAITVAGPSGYARTVTGPEALSDLVEGSYTISAANVVDDASTYAPTPATQTIAVSAGTAANAAVAYAASAAAPPPTSGLNLRIDGLYLTQSVQTMSGGVPLVSGRDGVLRVFAVANTNNAARPNVRVRFYNGGALVSSSTVPASAASVPTQVAEGTFTSSWNVAVSGSLIRPGLTVVADVDPENAVPEADESDNAHPRTGGQQSFDVRVVPTYNVRLVPIVQAATGQMGSVNPDELLRDTRRMLPLGAITVDVRAPYTTSYTLNSGSSGWGEVLSELYALRYADGSTRDYYGVAKVGYGSGVAGIGYIGAPVSMGWDYPASASGTMAHEVGHTFGRSHTPCGGVASADPSYPHAGGVTGAYGLDVTTGALHPPTRYDLMGYCDPRWISDYTYRSILDFRSSGGWGYSVAANQIGASVAMQPSLLVWGRITAAGEVVIEPAFRVVTAPAVPRGGGRYTIEGRDAGGARLFAVAFDGEEVAEGPNAGERHFAFTVPMDDATHARLATLELTGRRRATATRTDGSRRASAARAAGGASVAEAAPVAEPAGNGRVRVRWDRSVHPMALVRDPATGQILSFARGGAAEVVTARGELEVILSDRVQSVGQRVRVRGR